VCPVLTNFHRYLGLHRSLLMSISVIQFFHMKKLYYDECILGLLFIISEEDICCWALLVEHHFHFVLSHLLDT
jgi:hypothetical protein